MIVCGSCRVEGECHGVLRRYSQACRLKRKTAGEIASRKWRLEQMTPHEREAYKQRVSDWQRAYRSAHLDATKAAQRARLLRTAKPRYCRDCGKSLLGTRRKCWCHMCWRDAKNRQRRERYARDSDFRQHILFQCAQSNARHREKRLAYMRKWCTENGLKQRIGVWRGE